VREGVPMFLDDYVARFANSARLLQLELPISQEELKARIRELIAANGLPEAGIRLVLTGGYSPDGYAPAAPNLLIMEHELPPATPQSYDQGARLLSHQFQREIPQAKTINYLTGIRLLAEMKKLGAIEVLYHDGKFIRETARGNFFLITEDDTLVTAHEKVLPGITRKNVLQVARGQFKVEERDVLLDELQNAKEVFITSTNKRVMPIVQIDDLIIGNGKPGAVTKKIGEALQTYAGSYIEKYKVGV
jgi:branched-subunit amino acid aminotransferase/4-amino-4-deoxychorismate lyase